MTQRLRAKGTIDSFSPQNNPTLNLLDAQKSSCFQ